MKQVGFGVAVVELITGAGRIVTVVVAVKLGQPAAVAVKEYVPALSNTAANGVGSNIVLEKPFGPLHAYVVPMSVVPSNAKFAPTQTGLLLVALAVGVGFTVTVTSAVKAESPEMVHFVDIRMK